MKKENKIIFLKRVDNIKNKCYNKEKRKEIIKMAVSRKVERELLRESYIDKLIDFFKASEDVLRVKSNEIAFPVVGCNDSEDFIVITVKVPTGANKGTEPYDGYELAEDYERKLKEKELKKKEKAIAKEKKMKRDEEIRRKKAEIAEKKK